MQGKAQQSSPSGEMGLDLLLFRKDIAGVRPYFFGFSLFVVRCSCVGLQNVFVSHSPAKIGKERGGGLSFMYITTA